MVVDKQFEATLLNDIFQVFLPKMMMEIVHRSEGGCRVMSVVAL